MPTDIAAKLAGLKKRCPCLKADGSQDSLNGCDNCADYRPHAECLPCLGTGEVYVLPRVRVPCLSEKHDPCSGELGYEAVGAGTLYEWVVLPSCHGLGYTVSESLEAWLEAAHPWFKQHGWQLTSGYYCKWGIEDDNTRLSDEDTLIEAIQQAIAAALKAQGVMV